MTRAEKTKFVADCKSNANTAKEQLIALMNDLQGVSTREAETLEKIIIKLEVWQNK